METELKFLSSEPFFKGHFPGSPVTPGVMLIDRAVAAAGKTLGAGAVLEGMGKVKFTKPVLPDEQVLLRLEGRGDSDVAYSFIKDGGICASGVLRFRR